EDGDRIDGRRLEVVVAGGVAAFATGDAVEGLGHAHAQVDEGADVVGQLAPAHVMRAVGARIFLQALGVVGPVIDIGHAVDREVTVVLQVGIGDAGTDGDDAGQLHSQADLQHVVDVRLRHVGQGQVVVGQVFGFHRGDEVV